MAEQWLNYGYVLVWARYDLVLGSVAKLWLSIIGAKYYYGQAMS